MRVGRPMQHLIHGAGFHERAFGHHADAMGDSLHHGQVVRNQQDRQIQAPLQIAQQPQDLHLNGDIQRGRRLIGDEQRGPCGQRHGQTHALLHPARELMRIRPEALRGHRDADLLQPLDSQSSRFLVAHRCMPGNGLQQLRADRHDRVEARRGILEHVRNRPPSNRAQRLVRGIQHAGLLQHDSA